MADTVHLKRRLKQRRRLMLGSTSSLVCNLCEPPPDTELIRMPINYLRGFTAPERSDVANRRLGRSLAFVAGVPVLGGAIAAFVGLMGTLRGSKSA